MEDRVEISREIIEQDFDNDFDAQHAPFVYDRKNYIGV